MTNDERLIDILLKKSLAGYAILSVFNPDTGMKQRHNGKKTKLLKNLIIENGFEYKQLNTNYLNKEQKSDFIVYERNPENPELPKFIEKCKSINCFNPFFVEHDIEDFLHEKHFYHPLFKDEKNEYIKRKEIILTDLFEPPQVIDTWTAKKANSESYVIYEKRNLLCIISELEDGKWNRSFGCIRPTGILLKNEILNTRDAAFTDLDKSLSQRMKS